MNLKCLLGKHDWVLTKGVIPKSSISAYQLFDPEFKLLTYHEYTESGDMVIYAWICSNCEKRKAATKDDVFQKFH